MNLRMLASATVIAATLAGTAVSAQQVQPNLPGQVQPARPGLRGGRGSDQNLRVEIRRLERVIDMLQRDQHDYGGHRVQAINLLQQARAQLAEGLQYDKGH